jgi:hypothetical protein
MASVLRKHAVSKVSKFLKRRLHTLVAKKNYDLLTSPSAVACDVDETLENQLNEALEAQFKAVLGDKYARPVLLV